MIGSRLPARRAANHDRARSASTSDRSRMCREHGCDQLSASAERPCRLAFLRVRAWRCRSDRNGITLNGTLQSVSRQKRSRRFSHGALRPESAFAPDATSRAKWSSGSKRRWLNPASSSSYPVTAQVTRRSPRQIREALALVEKPLRPVAIALRRLRPQRESRLSPFVSGGGTVDSLGAFQR